MSTEVKKRGEKLFAEIVLKSCEGGQKVEVQIETLYRRPNVFDNLFFNYREDRVGRSVRTKEYWFDTETEATKFVRDLGRELLDKDYDVEATKTIVTKEVIKLE